MESKVDTGKMLLVIRKVRGIYQSQLENDSDVPASYISRFENGTFVLSDEHLAKIEEALGVKFAEVRPAFDALVDAVTPAPAPSNGGEEA